MSAQQLQGERRKIRSPFVQYFIVQLLHSTQTWHTYCAALSCHYTFPVSRVGQLFCVQANQKKERFFPPIRSYFWSADILDIKSSKTTTQCLWWLPHKNIKKLWLKKLCWRTRSAERASRYWWWKRTLQLPISLSTICLLLLFVCLFWGDVAGSYFLWHPSIAVCLMPCFHKTHLPEVN